jgi:hypothetical protein
VPLNAIEEVVPTRGPVSISPQDKAGFLQELAAAVPGLKVVGDGLGE